MRPLEQIASGGELSRVMLALKASVEAGANPSEEEEIGCRPTHPGL